MGLAPGACRACAHQIDRLLGFAGLVIDQRQQRHGVFVAGSDAHRLFRVGASTRLIALLQACRTARGQQIGIVRRDRKPGFERFHRFVGSAGIHIDLGQLRARAEMFGIHLDGGLEHLRRFAQITQMLARLAGEKTGLGIVGIQLQRIAELQPRFLEIMCGQIFLALGQIAGFARRGAAAGHQAAWLITNAAKVQIA